MKIAQRFGQPPHEVAEWPGEWLAAAETAMVAENGAEAELRRRQERQAKARGAAGR